MSASPTPAGSPEFQPRRGELLQMFCIAVGIRLAVFLTVLLVAKISTTDYANWWDGKSYLRMAQTFAGHPPPELREYDHRVFPGLPGLLSLVYLLGLPLAKAALVTNWLLSGLCAVLAARLFNDRRMGWALVTLTPHFVATGSMVMTEALMMATTLGTLLLARQQRSVLGGIVAGVGGLVRPMVCFAVIGQMFDDLRRGRWRRSLQYGSVAVLTIALGLALLQWKTGDALQGPKVYAHHPWAYGGDGGKMFDWPFHSFVVSMLEDKIPPLTIAFVLLHLVVVLMACFRLVSRYRREGRESDPLLLPMMVWLLGNTLFMACVGSHWAFSQFPRFTVVALPPLLWAFLPQLPRRTFGWAACGVVSYGLAVLVFGNKI